ncbi:MAG: peptidase M14 [Cytophagaceae bacterium]|nr:peptidase M14 [Cytophagaceae bacterium]|tara:strand:+ start:370 stop:1554 length:1185 start_codon:yes stop_codon:yes gene_type:complete
MTASFDYNQLLKWHKENKESSLHDRYITLSRIAPLFQKLDDRFSFEVIGQSVEHRDIHKITWGKGPLKVLAWSQMHGNESTTTKALFDLFRYLSLKNDKNIEALYNALHIVFIPMLNPDGAERFTRLNAVEVDLNRDAQHLSQPESRVLRGIFDKFKPKYCFNLHGQRTIFSVGEPAKPATVSFLSPAEEKKRTVTYSRKAGMAVINAMNSMLQQFIPGQVGRYDDGFNENCVGDTFQMMGAHTVLFEAGHYPGDYKRDVTRQYIFLSYVRAFEYLLDEDIKLDGVDEAYMRIPDNEKKFTDIIIRNLKLPKVGVVDVAVQYEEKLVHGEIQFIPRIHKVADLRYFEGHREVDGKGCKVSKPSDIQWKEGDELNEITINAEIPTTFSLFLDKKL